MLLPDAMHSFSLTREAYRHAEAQIHVASQVIALTGKNFGAPRADDSHTTAVWDTERRLLIGREFSSNGTQFAVCVAPEAFTLGVLRNGTEVYQTPLDGLTYRKTVARWKTWLSEAGISNTVDVSLHYTLPESDIYAFDTFTKPKEAVLSRWSHNRSLANTVLQRLSERVGADSDINVWPHHFDSGTYYELHETDGVTDRSIGAGFTPADDMVPEPYFYIYGWDKDRAIDYTDAPRLESGKWVIADWKGAVLPITDVQDQSTVDEFFAVTASYVKDKLI